MSKLDQPFIQACLGQKPKTPPLWLMRQAGRYLPEYRAIRANTSFETLCSTPELAAEVTLQPIRRYDFDAAIIFSDILVVSDALGCPIHFPKGGPKAEKPIRNRADIDALTVTNPKESLGFVMDALSIVRRELPPTTSLIGFAGAPLTVACYMVEGGASKTFSKIKSLIFHQPQDAHALLEKITALTSQYLRAQVEAGADAIQVFDTWASILPKYDYQNAVLPHLIQLFQSLQDLDVPKIYFAKGASHLLEYIKDIQPSVAGIDWGLPLPQARQLINLGPQFPIQGNLDPIILLGDQETLRRRIRQVIDSVEDKHGYIFNLGHGILKETKPENVSVLVDEVRKQNS